jgi:dTDP-4-dehydrorhamnose reductase
MHLIFRTSWVYSPHGNNFFLTMLRLGKERRRLRVVNDQLGAPTSAIELADATRHVVQGVLSGADGPPKQWSGLYHLTCAGAASWFDFARAIFDGLDPEFFGGDVPVVEPTTSAEFPSIARRPANSVLSNAKLRSRFQYEMPEWRDALGKVITRFVAREETAPRQTLAATHLA